MVKKTISNGTGIPENYARTARTMEVVTDDKIVLVEESTFEGEINITNIETFRRKLSPNSPQSFTNE